jgi:hypothetical protein
MNPGFHLVLGRWKSGFTCFSVGLAVMISFSHAALRPGDVVAIGVWLPWREHQILSGDSCPACPLVTTRPGFQRPANYVVATTMHT